MKLILIFLRITKKKFKLTEIGVNTYYLELMFILINIFQQQKLMKKVILKETLFLKKKDKKRQKKPYCEFIRINTSKEGSDADYEASRIQAFISEFKEKEKGSKIKELEDEIKKLKLQLTL